MEELNEQNERPIEVEWSPTGMTACSLAYLTSCNQLLAAASEEAQLHCHS